MTSGNVGLTLLVDELGSAGHSVHFGKELIIFSGSGHIFRYRLTHYKKTTNDLGEIVIIILCRYSDLPFSSNRTTWI